MHGGKERNPISEESQGPLTLALSPETGERGQEEIRNPKNRKAPSPWSSPPKRGRGDRKKKPEIRNVCTAKPARIAGSRIITPA